MVRLSIIVPVYNVENYLKQCIESITSQSFENYELILINDGSTDNSGEICDKFAKKYSQITVYHKNNGGLSDARNYGINNANGEYIVFIDSDDYIEPESFRSFHKHLEKNNNPDIMITRIKKVYDDNVIRHMDEDTPLNISESNSKEEILKWMLEYSDNLWPSVRYVVKKSLIDQKKLIFPVGYLHEDVDWTFKLFIYGKTFSYNPIYWYNHRMERVGAITNTKNVKRTLDMIDLVALNINDIQTINIHHEFKEIMCRRILKSIFPSLKDYSFYSKEERKLVIEKLNDNKSLLKYIVNLKHKTFVLFSSLFGFKIGLNVLSFINKLTKR